ncbi:MAG: hypothetical protein KatS3mg129_2917 [Leptospiraceae bacterium]|nr:MAG: hypothetical protein KatS3mg129_2917 [Leptospiraceae bacterium]
MILDILLPLLIYLNEIQYNKQLYQIPRTFFLFDNSISKEELDNIEKELQIKHFISEINLLFFIGKDKEAYTKTQELKEYKEAEAYYNYFLAVWESKQGNNLKAQIYLSKALSLNQEIDPAWNLMGYLQSLAGDFQNALISFKKAIELEPYHPVYRYNLARTYWILKQNDLALKEIDQCIKLRDNFPEAYYLKGMILENSNPEEALIYYNKALERHFLVDEFLIKFFHLAIQYNKKDYILKLLEKTQNTQNQELMLLRFYIFLEYGEYNKALKELFTLLSNGLSTEEEFNKHLEILKKAEKFNCNSKKEIQLFVENNKKKLSEFKVQFLRDIISSTCKSPVDLKDPLINPAL